MTIEKLKPLYTSIFSTLMDKAATDGTLMIDNGVWLCSMEQMLEEQNDSGPSEAPVRTDYTDAAYWITTDSEALPVPINSIDDMIDHPLSDQWIEFATKKRITELTQMSDDAIAALI